MGALQRLECVELSVADEASALEFYTDMMGLVEIDRDGETTYLGCGMDARYDLAVRPGAPGIDRFAMRVTEAELEDHVASLEAHGVETHQRRGPGHERGLYFDLPVTGVTMGLVVVEDNRYQHEAGVSDLLPNTAPVSTDRAAVAPSDVHHLGLTCGNVEREATFLDEVVGFQISDVQLDEGDWRIAFVRMGIQHLDISIFKDASADNPQHIAWGTRNVAQMELFADKLAQSDHALETAFVKHGPGANVSIYFAEPGGHRFEYNTGMSTVEPDCPTGFHDRSDRSGMDLWTGS